MTTFQARSRMVRGGSHTAPSPPRSADIRTDPVVYALPPDEDVGCYFCQREGDHETRGEFLTGADHSPCNGEANYVCPDHLDARVVICPLPEGGTDG